MPHWASSAVSTIIRSTFAVNLVGRSCPEHSRNGVQNVKAWTDVSKCFSILGDLNGLDRCKSTTFMSLCTHRRSARPSATNVDTKNGVHLGFAVRCGHGSSASSKVNTRSAMSCSGNIASHSATHQHGESPGPLRGTPTMYFEHYFPLGSNDE